MGQYRQWLHYRHVDQQLQTQKNQLTTAVKHLQEQIDALNAPALDTNNTIAQALALYIKTRSASPQDSVFEQTLTDGHLQESEIISQALFDHSRLEPLHAKDTHEPNVPKRPTSNYTSPSLIAYKAIGLVPEATKTPSDEQGQTQPQVALPWWLRKDAISQEQDSTLDAQSVRTDHSVQRWLERWGRQEEQASQAPHTNGQLKSPQQEGTKP